MKTTFLNFALICLTLTAFSACSSAPVREADQTQRYPSSKECIDNIKAEYHSYFDNVEKCIEKE